MGGCLYVGMDDSNHAGENVKGEINTAIFSFLHEDSIVKIFHNRRDSDFAERWIQHDQRDYRFTILTGEKWRSASNLVYTAPLLINSFIRNKPDIKVDSLKLYLDGYLNSEGKRYLKREFSNLLSFTVSNFIKKENHHGRTLKRPRCPTLVYVADAYANTLFNNSIEDCLRNEKYIPFSS